MSGLCYGSIGTSISVNIKYVRYSYSFLILIDLCANYRFIGVGSATTEQQPEGESL
jgi:hypothetical protein